MQSGGTAQENGQKRRGDRGTNRSSKGDKCSHGGKNWVSAADANTWEPGVYGWDEVTDEKALQGPPGEARGHRAAQVDQHPTGAQKAKGGAANEKKVIMKS